MRKLVDLWCERFNVMKSDEKIKYVFPFENRGEAVGVTMPHPHGQMYGYSFIPKRLEVETQNAREYYEENGRNLFADMLDNERKFGARIIFSNEAFTVYLPFYTDYPYGVYIVPNRQVVYITELSDHEKDLLGITIRDTVGMFDNLLTTASRT